MKTFSSNLPFNEFDDTNHSNRSYPAYLLLRDDDSKDPDGIESPSRTNQAAAFSTISRSFGRQRSSRLKLRRFRSGKCSEFIFPPTLVAMRACHPVADRLR